jgi:hypothetical protein
VPRAPLLPLITGTRAATSLYELGIASTLAARFVMHRVELAIVAADGGSCAARIRSNERFNRRSEGLHVQMSAAVGGALPIITVRLRPGEAMLVLSLFWST